MCSGPLSGIGSLGGLPPPSGRRQESLTEGLRSTRILATCPQTAAPRNYAVFFMPHSNSASSWAVYHGFTDWRAYDKTVRGTCACVRHVGAEFSMHRYTLLLIDLLVVAAST